VTDSAVLSKFIARNAVVVDKTALIHDLFDSSDSTYFLARPRRFGKTLLLDTIQNIANGSRKLFSNMAIGKDDSGYSWEKYPVIRLSFGGFPSEPNAFRQWFLEKLNQIVSHHCLDIKPVRHIASIEKIIEAVSSKHPIAEMSGRTPEMSGDRFNVVLLIDEYDFPLLGNLNNSTKLNKIRKMLHGFYSSIKNCDNKLRLTFITGVSKFSQLSIFSGLNNIIDISFDPNYSTICGFTEDEIILNFSSHILSALSRLKKVGVFPEDSDADYFIERLKYWYDGYTWWNKDTTVYNPFSVVKCLKYQRFDYYWYNSGTSLAAYEFKHMAEIYFKILSNNLTFKETVGSISDINDIQVESLLFQTGYLTIDGKIHNDKITDMPQPGGVDIGKKSKKFKNIEESEESEGMTFKLKCPNNEIFFTLIQDFVKMKSPFPGFDGSIKQTYSSFVDSFNSLDANECARIFSSFLGQIDSTLKDLNETTFRNLLICLLNIRKPRARPEQILGSGRCDIVYTSPSNTLIVTEIKYKKGNILTASPKPKVLPPPDTKLPAFQEMHNDAKEILEFLLAEAFSLIVTKKYVRPFYKSCLKTIACTVAIHGYDDCLFRFYSIDWSAQRITPITSFNP
jgi:hypothetical protein